MNPSVSRNERAEPFQFAGVGAATDLSVVAETLFPECFHPIRNATVYTNIAELTREFGRHHLDDIYTERTCSVAPITLARLPAGAVLFGGDEFLVGSGGCLLQEQIAPYLRDNHDLIREITSTWRPTMRVSEESLLVARFGIYTWGHWLGELLPKIVLAEACFPGRFRYLLPTTVLTDPDPGLPTVRIRETLHAYGIGRERVLPLYPATDYQFDRLHTLGPIWSDHIMHPSIASLMRKRLVPAANPSREAAPSRRICLIRNGPGRAITNLAEVHELLGAHGFEFHTLSTMAFTAQIDLFQTASVVFAVLGSDLSDLIYAPDGIKVISAAPAIFGDRFFYALIVSRNGTYADLRGPVVELDRRAEHRSSFYLDLSKIRMGLNAMGVGK